MTNIFNNAKIIEYNGKEVKSITTINGRVIWKKEELVFTMTATVTGESVSLGKSMVTGAGDILINWGDETTTTKQSGDARYSTHNYTDGQSEHTIGFIGEITSLGNYCFQSCTGLTSITIPNTVTNLGQGCFYGCTGLTSIIIPNTITSLEPGCFYGCTGLTSITIPNTVTSLGNGCFNGCTGLTSITIPNTVTSLGNGCFNGCSALTDYQLYWTNNDIITYNSTKMPNNTNSIFTIPIGETANYVAKGYPSDKLVERGGHNYSLSLQSNKDILSYADDDSATLTAVLTDNNQPVSGETLFYTVKYGATTIDSGSDTTDVNGEISFSYTATGVGDVDIEVHYGSVLQETVIIEDCLRYDDALSDKSSNYSYSNLSSFSYVTDHYEANRTLGDSASTFYSPIYVDDTLPTNYEISVDMSVQYFRQWGISIASNHPQTYQNTTEFGILCNARRETVFSRLNGSGTFKSDNNINLSTDTYYTFKVKVEGTTLTGTITDSNGVVKYSNTMEVSYAQSHKKWSIINGESTNILKFKNLKIKALSSPELSLTATEPIIESGDSTTITATLTDRGIAMVDETLSYTIKHGSTVIDTGSDTTDNNGEISFSYTATGINDANIEVNYGSLLQETYVIEDCLYWNDGTNTHDITVGTGVSVTNQNGYIKITTSTSGEKYCWYPPQFNTNSNFSYEMEFSNTGYANLLAIVLKNGSTATGLWAFYDGTKFGGGTGGSSLGTYNWSYSTPAKFKLERKDGVNKFYINDVLFKTISSSLTDTWQVGHYTNQNRVQYIKNIKIKTI